MKTIETAIMPFGGAGTRVLPATWAVDKPLLAISEGDRLTPMVSIMVDECALAGIKRILMVTTDRGQRQLQDLFGPINPHIEAQLIGLGKKDILEAEKERRNSLPIIEWVNQPKGKYGTAYPPSLARNRLEGEKNFVLLGGDDFVWREDGTSELSDAISLLDKAETDHVIMGNPLKKRSEGPKYGIFQTDDNGRLRFIDERPPLERVPENPIMNISRYILSDKIWGCIGEVMNRVLQEGEEYRITDVINQAIDLDQSFQVHPVSGKYFDCGSPSGLLEASNYFTAHPRK